MKRPSDLNHGCAARKPAALRCGTALLVLTLMAACGPRDVPLPPEMRPNTAGEDSGTGAIVSGGSGGSAAAPSGGRTGAAGRTGSADGGRSVSPEAGGGAGEGSGEPFFAGDDPNRNHVQAGSLCARLAVIQCAAEAHCCFAPGRTREDCEASIRASCSSDLYLDQIASNAITGFDAATAATTYTELETRSAACDIGIAEWGLVALRSILKGTRAPNQSCKPPVTALNDKPTQAAALASCTDLAQHACLPTSLLGDWTCAAKSGNGGNCVTEDNCQTGMFCRTTNMALLGKCMQRLELGASCANGTECASLYCKGAKCVAAEQQVAFCLK